ncbi:DNA mismatch repair protein MutS [Sphingobacterium oryzagri]|uniref:DNA mismatch repair protein MutS n=1 Tax=Sphingobacterium oryzagri TaxID=3025669 RepID=A0ABY7WD15_9SPHI|nr:DNA mismatch repair protein MutS [Sphingobacterium sp. KACC 22765]WDF67548.1 DNA mismatch repair protein MutS [Sphingobacterium sp. KACC 22765]
MFQTDKQTLTDINALDWNSASLLRFFDHTQTLGGRDMLYAWFLQPLHGKREIIERQQAIAYLAKEPIEGLFDKYMMADLERYASTPTIPATTPTLSYFIDSFWSVFSGRSHQVHRLFIRQSVCEIASICLTIHALVETSKTSGEQTGVFKRMEHLLTQFLNGLDLSALRKLTDGKTHRALILQYDKLFRSTKQRDLASLFEILYTLDALSGIAKTLHSNLLSFPVINEQKDTSSLLEIHGLYHIALENPIKNDVIVRRDKNIWFLTGANMTGKSTLLKSVGSCVYLAHIGLPVPAVSMHTALFAGMFTSINLADQMATGFSHFFAEVNRLKTMGRHIAAHGPMLILLDELFKGTNYEDAYEATLAFLDSVDSIADSVFFVSTHITDLGVLLEKRAQVALKCLDTQADNQNGITFTYKLVDGVATAKLGLWFLKREQVFETFRSIGANNR